MEFVIGGLAATSAGFFTNPLEVVKHHMEMSKKSQLNRYSNFLHAGYQVAKQDGFKSMQKGLSPALGAYLVSYGMKLGTYQFGQNRGFTTKENGEVNVSKSVLTSSVGGLLGQYLSNPFYLVKTKHEIDQVPTAENSNNSEKKSAGYMDTIKKIYREHGIRGFFRGATASLPRAFIGTSQLTTFAVAKESLNKFETFQQNPFFSTVLAGTAAGVVLSMAMTPFDMVLTNMYKQAIGAKPKGQYSSSLDCMKKIYMKNGLKPFYKGMGPLYLKLGPHTMLCLVFWEEFKGLYENYGENVNNVPPPSPVPMNNFYQKIGFLNTDRSNKVYYFNENLDEDNKANVYWN
ncbi:hypothetical protein JTB14_008611 [Gonioctena quinquepunctata]|nr:hypothetical protein JTB14_008611 [Gonioctena quinquepunctata]